MKINDPGMAQQMSLEHIAPKAPNAPKASKFAAKGDSPEAIREVARSFESLFINEIMKNMRKTLPKDGILSKGFANNVFNSMLDQEYSQIASRSGQFGLAEAIARQLGADPMEIAQREEARAAQAGASSVDGDGDELPAWTLSEIQADPWTPGAGQVNPQDDQQVTPGLSAPRRSEFVTRDELTPAVDPASSSGASPEAPSEASAVAPSVVPLSSGQRARQAYQALTQPVPPSAQTRVKR